MPNSEIRLLVLDVDGVLTDGTLLMDDTGRQGRRFHIHDGLGVKMWQALGRQAAILTSKQSETVLARARMMGITLIEQGAEDKAPGLERIAEQAGVGLDQIAYIGDDLLDAVAMRRVAYPIAVANAVAEIRELARYVTQRTGGRGAVREAVEHLLRRENLWDRALTSIGADRGR